jgi:uncharacterized LabA/DUF88 family protein
LLKSNIALLIDADNIAAFKITGIIAELSKHGDINIRRAYGNWSNAQLSPWKEYLHELAITPIQQFDLTKGKNATDMAMVIDVMDLLYLRHLDTFALVSSDSDFTPLVTRILTSGFKVYGFGERKTPNPFVKACSTFFYIETIGQSSPKQENSPPSQNLPAGDKLKQNSTIKAATTKKTGAELKKDFKAINLLREAVAAAMDKDGWSSMSAIGTKIKPSNYGYGKLSSLFKALDLFEVQQRQGTSYVREKKTANTIQAQAHLN